MQPTLQDIIIGWAPTEFANLHVPFNKGKAQDGLHDRFEMRFLMVTEALNWGYVQPLVMGSDDQANDGQKAPAATSSASADEAPAKRPKVQHDNSAHARNGLEPKCIGALVQWYRLCNSWHDGRQYQRCQTAMDNMYHSRQNIKDQVNFKLSK